MGTDDAEPKAGDVHDAVAAVVADGLPIRLADPIGPLLKLQGVIARSVKPDDSLSRLDALNKLLKQLIRKWPKEKERQALSALLGIEKGYAGRTLTDRRERAAQQLSYDPTHFRRRIEPKLLEDLSAVVWQDHLRYTPRTKYAPPITEASGDTPVLGPGDYNEQEELVSRIWSEVYALRAEIIAGGRIKRDQSTHEQLPEARAKILWRTAKLLKYIEDYLQRYGDRIIQGETEWQVEGLIRLAGWKGDISESDRNRMRLVLVEYGGDSWAPFLPQDA
jgi:hypothetical protein